MPESWFPGQRSPRRFPFRRSRGEASEPLENISCGRNAAEACGRGPVGESVAGWVENSVPAGQWDDEEIWLMDADKNTTTGSWTVARSFRADCLVAGREEIRLRQNARPFQSDGTWDAHRCI